MVTKHQCVAVYGGLSVAKGGRCLLEAGHAGDHKTHGIISGPSPSRDGSQGFEFRDAERSDLRDTHVEREITTGARPDPAVNPKHYLPANGDTTYECIKVIDAWELDFELGNCVKYISRAGKKTPDKLTDLRKAAWYLTHAIKKLEDKA